MDEEIGTGHLWQNFVIPRNTKVPVEESLDVFTPLVTSRVRGRDDRRRWSGKMSTVLHQPWKQL